jgi:transcriptional regulator with XRE-family HTH domain
MARIPVGQKIDLTRAKQYRTGKGVADHAGISPETLSRIERGRVKPRLDTISRIAEALEISLEELVEDTDQEFLVPKVEPPLPFEVGEAAAVADIEKSVDYRQVCINLVRRIL